MRRSSWCAEPLRGVLRLCLLLSLMGCATDHDRIFDPAERAVIIVPEPGSFDRSPTVNDDGRVLAWTRTYTGVGRVGTNSVFYWDRGSSDPTTLSAATRAMAEVDLSPDGRRLVGIPAGDYTWIAVWTPDSSRAPLEMQVPDAYTGFTSPRWIDSSSILFGAIGPDGAGVYRWTLLTGVIEPVCTRFTSGDGLWTGSSPGLDRAGARVCMERSPQQYYIDSIVARSGSAEILLEINGELPSFWALLPGEEDGILYIDGQSRLKGMRGLNRGVYTIASRVFDYDVSADGKWIVADLTLEIGRTLTLIDVRDLR